MLEIDLSPLTSSLHAVSLGKCCFFPQSSSVVAFKIKFKMYLDAFPDFPCGSDGSFL